LALNKLNEKIMSRSQKGYENKLGDWGRETVANLSLSIFRGLVPGPHVDFLFYWRFHIRDGKHLGRKIVSLLNMYRLCSVIIS
jgi:hypothetical protein